MLNKTERHSSLLSQATSHFCASICLCSHVIHMMDGVSGRLQVAMPELWDGCRYSSGSIYRSHQQRSLCPWAHYTTSLGHTSLNSKVGGLVTTSSKGKGTQNGAHPIICNTEGLLCSLSPPQSCGYWINPRKTEAQCQKECDDSIRTTEDPGSHTVEKAHTVPWGKYKCTYMKAKVAQSCPTPHDPMGHTVHGILQARIWQWAVWIVFPCSRGIFLTQRWNPGLLHGRWILYQLSHKVSPRILEWVAFPFSSRFSQPRNWTGVSCIAGGFVTYWAIREAISTLLCFKSQLHKHVYSHNLWFKHHLFIDSKGHRSQFKGKLN